MERFDSAPMPLPPAVREGQYSSADLIFYDVDHSSRSFEALIFLNAPDVGAGTGRELEAGFAGSFVIFGHGGCFGDEGHCHVPTHHKDPFDSRPLHPLTAQTKTVEVTEALKRVGADSDSLIVTALAIVPDADGPQLRDLLSFSSMRFVAYD
jgi:tyrosinase